MYAIRSYYGAGIRKVALPARNRKDLEDIPDSVRKQVEFIWLAPHRYSGRTAMRANIDVSEPQVPQDSDSPFAFSIRITSYNVCYTKLLRRKF